MSVELENKSIPKLLDRAFEVIKEYNILFDNILGVTPEERKEMRKILEGFTSTEIREALEWYKPSHPK